MVIGDKSGELEQDWKISAERRFWVADWRFVFPLISAKTVLVLGRLPGFGGGDLAAAAGRLRHVFILPDIAPQFRICTFYGNGSEITDSFFLDEAVAGFWDVVISTGSTGDRCSDPLREHVCQLFRPISCRWWVVKGLATQLNPATATIRSDLASLGIKRTENVPPGS